MAEYTFNAPGKEEYVMTGPDGYTEAQATVDFNKSYVPHGKRGLPQGQGAYDAEIIRMNAGHKARLQGDEEKGYFANKFGPKNRMEEQREDYVNPFMAGMGGAMKQPYNWVKQAGANVLNDMGLMSDEYKSGVDKNVVEDKQMYENLTRKSAYAGAGGMTGDMAWTAPVSTLAKTAKAIANPYKFGMGVGAGISGTQPVEDPEDFWGKTTGNAILGAITGAAVTKATKYFPERYKYRDTSIENAERKMKGPILGGSPEGTKLETGRAVGEHLTALKDMTKKEVTSLYEGAKKSYGNDVDIPMDGFLNSLKQPLSQTGTSKFGEDVRAVNQLVKSFIKENNKGALAGIKKQFANKEISKDEAAELIKELPQNINVHQLDTLDKMVGMAWSAGKKKLNVDKHGGWLMYATQMKKSLEGSLKGQRAEAVFAVAKQKFETTKSAQSINIGGSEVSLRRFVDKAKPEEVSKKLFFEGSIDNVLKAKDILLKGHKNIKGMDGAKGTETWNKARAQLFADMLDFANPNIKGKKLVNPDKFQDMLDKLGPDKFKAIFSEKEQKIMKSIASVDDRTALEILKSTFGGPRLTWEGRMFREVGKILVKALFQSKESAGFARKVAEHLQIKPTYNALGDAVSRFPKNQLTGSLTRESISDQDALIKRLKARAREFSGRN
tara:strand:+ start:9727 stop:11727 length:2001 start_codon:yes stop_codon:yes gene_type:complete